MLRKFLLLGSLFLVGCQTVTIRPDNEVKTSRAANYEQRQNFFAWGLAPSAVFIDVNEVCKDKEVEQLQTQNTFLDGFLSVITIGIYNPRTARVWCKS